MRKNKLGRVGAVTAGVIGISLLTAPMAFASATVSVTGSKAGWDSAGNVLSSTDTLKDGVSSVAQLKNTLNGTTYIATLTNSNGVGTSYSYQNKSITGTVYLRACLNNRSAGTGIYGCSSWVATAG